MGPKDISDKDRLIFAMDVPDCDAAMSLAQELGDAVTFVVPPLAGIAAQALARYV